MAENMQIDGIAVEVILRQEGDTDQWEIEIDQETVKLKGNPAGERFSLFRDGQRTECAKVIDKNGLWIWIDGRSRFVSFVDPDDGADEEAEGNDRAPMPSVVVAIKVEIGQPVNAGDDLAVISAMKMEMVLKAVDNGIVTAIVSKAGETVAAGDRVVIVERDHVNEDNNE